MSDSALANILTVIGWLTTAWMAYRLGLRSQKLQRKYAELDAARDRRVGFIAFVKTWKFDISKTYLQPGGYSRRGSNFTDHVSEFVAQCEWIRADLPVSERKIFDQLQAAVASCRGGDVLDKDGHKKIQQGLDKLIEFVESKETPSL